MTFRTSLDLFSKMVQNNNGFSDGYGAEIVCIIGQYGINKYMMTANNGFIYNIMSLKKQLYHTNHLYFYL